MKQLKMEPSKVGPVDKIKWSAIRLFMITLGKTSQGVRIGYRYGFNSGSMLDHVYRNTPQGILLVGKALDRIYLNAIGWRAIRKRRTLLQEMLREQLGQNRAAGKETRLLDIAAGPGRYLQELLKEDSTGFKVLCRDIAEEGLAEGRAEARQAGLAAISFETGDAFQPAPTQTTLGGPPNIIVVSGLYEQIQDNELVRSSLGTLYQLLEPGGTIFFTTQTNHPQLDFIANVMTNREGTAWMLKCRKLSQVEQWAAEVGFEEISSRMEGEGLCAVTKGRKN